MLVRQIHDFTFCVAKVLSELANSPSLPPADAAQPIRTYLQQKFAAERVRIQREYVEAAEKNAQDEVFKYLELKNVLISQTQPQTVEDFCVKLKKFMNPTPVSEGNDLIELRARALSAFKYTPKAIKSSSGSATSSTFTVASLASSLSVGVVTASSSAHTGSTASATTSTSMHATHSSAAATATSSQPPILSHSVAAATATSTSSLSILSSMSATTKPHANTSSVSTASSSTTSSSPFHQVQTVMPKGHAFIGASECH